MNRLNFDFHGAALEALPSGALHWPSERCLVVADLHFGKCARVAAGGGAALPPYDTAETLARLGRDIAATAPHRVICLGDSVDSAAIGAALPDAERQHIALLQTGRRWTWIAGNHDPAPTALGGEHMTEAALGPLVFRHIATAGAAGEVSGHYHPKVRLLLKGRALSRPAFLVDRARLILPAYGAYAGGLFSHGHTLTRLMGAEAEAILCGATQARLPMPRAARAALRA